MSDERPTKLEWQMRDLEALRAQLLARAKDLAAERYEEKRYLYAIDTNVVYFLAQPVAQTLGQNKLDPAEHYLYGSREQLPHIGSVFRADPMHFHLVIGLALARFIIESLPATSPLYFPDALYVETDALLAHLAASDGPGLLELAAKNAKLLAERALGPLRARDDVDSSVYDALEAELRKLVRQRIGREEGLLRLEMLFNGPIQPLLSRGVPGRVLRSGSFADLRQQVQGEVNAFATTWDDELKAVGKLSEPHRKVDADALAQIQYRNEMSYDHGNVERILYITSDAQVTAAARNVMMSDGRNFADACIRHPSAYLNDIGLGIGRSKLVSETRTNTEPASLLDWVEVLLARRDVQTEDQAAAADHIRTSWAALSNIQEGQLFFDLGLPEIEDVLGQHLARGSVEDALTSLRSESVSREADAWQKCFDVAAELALRSPIREVPIATRSAPVICFEAWSGAGRAVEQFKVWGYKGLSSRAEYQRCRALLWSIDPTGYAYYLAFAAFFSARGDWGPAASLAAFAREMAFRDVAIDRGGANGREGAFFEAACRRHTATARTDLARVKDLLDECERIYAVERERFASGMEVVPERFDLERIDLEQTELLFNWDAAGGFDEVIKARVHSSLSRYESLQQRLAPQVDAWLRTSDAKQAQLGSFGHIRTQTEIRTLVSALLLAALGDIEQDRDRAAQIERLLGRLTILRQATRAVPGRSAGEEDALPLAQDGSLIAEVGASVAQVMLDEHLRREPDRQPIRRALELLSANQLRPRFLYPFDGKRFARLREVLNRNLRR